MAYQNRGSLGKKEDCGSPVRIMEDLFFGNSRLGLVLGSFNPVVDTRVGVEKGYNPSTQIFT